MFVRPPVHHTGAVLEELVVEETVQHAEVDQDHQHVQELAEYKSPVIGFKLCER